MDRTDEAVYCSSEPSYSQSPPPHPPRPLPPLIAPTPSLAGLPAEIKLLLFAKVKYQDRAYKARRRKKGDPRGVYGKGFESLASVNRDFRTLAMKPLYSRLRVKTFTPFPRSLDFPRLPNPLEYVDSVQFKSSLHENVKFIPSLALMPNLSELDLRDKDGQLLSALADMPEADSGDDITAAEGGLTGHRVSIYTRVFYLREAMSAAQDCFPKILGRLSGITLGGARHEDQFPYLLEDLNKYKLRKLSLGYNKSKINRPYQSHLLKHPSPELLSSLSRFRNLEELSLGSKEGLGEGFGATTPEYATMLRKLSLHVPKIDSNLADFFAWFWHLESFHLDLHSHQPIHPDSDYRYLEMEFPELQELRLSLRTTDASRIFSIFPPLPKLRNVIIDLDPDQKQYIVAEITSSEFDALLLPLCDEPAFPTLETITFPFRASQLSSRTMRTRSFDDLVPTRPSLRIVFESENIPIPPSPFAKLENRHGYPVEESEKRRMYHEEIEEILRWSMQEFEELKGENRNRDGVGATAEAEEMLKHPEGLYELKRRKLD